MQADLITAIQALASAPADLNEADTRARLIDPVLEALGWTRQTIKREPYVGWSHNRDYLDYLLLIDEKPFFVVEAKKTGRAFELPQELTKQQITSFKRLMAVANPDLREAIEQCLRYTQHTGALYACATNGRDWLILKPNHQHRPLPDARVIVFAGAEAILKGLDLFSNLLGRKSVEQGQAEKRLVGREIQVPRFAKRLRDAYPYRKDLSLEEEDYSHILDQLLAHYVIDITGDELFEKCYVAVRTNKRTATSLDALIANQIERVQSPTKSAAEFSSAVIDQLNLPDFVAGRTVILHGAVGVGKTSFLRSCYFTLRRSNALQTAVWAQVDLLDFRDRPFDGSTVGQMLRLLCERIQERVSTATQNMAGRYDPDTWEHLRDIYNHEVRKFQKLKYPGSTDADKDFIHAVRDYVWHLRENDPQEHLLRVIHWLTVHCRLPVVIVLDNSDQLGLEFQEFLYKLAETFQKKTSAVTILVLRTTALASHRIREHAIASVVEQYQIQRAQLPLVLERRFQAMEARLKEIGEAKLTQQHRVAIERISVLMDTLEYEAEVGSEAFQIIEGIGNDSLRDSLRSVAAIFRSSPKWMDKLVVDQHRQGHARLHAKAALFAIMKEDLSAPDGRRLLPNLFEGDPGVRIPYALPLRIIQQITSRSAVVECSVAEILNALALAGIDRDLAARILVRLRYDKFVEVPHMLPDVRDDDHVRVSRLGALFCATILRYACYYEHMVFEVYVYDEDEYSALRNIWNSVSEFRLKFPAMGKALVRMILADDEDWRKTVTLALLEPSLSEPLRLGTIA